MTFPYVIIAAFPFVVGLGVAGYGLVLWLRIQDLRQRGQTSGIVVDNEITSYAQGRLRFRPAVRFHDGAGREVTFVGAAGRNRSYVKVPVSWSSTTRTTRAAAVGTGGTALTYLVAGLVFAGVGIAIYLLLLRQNP